MEKFFNPASIAVVGASERRGGSQIVGNLRRGYRGPVYPVNPNYREIQGMHCFPDLESIPAPVDLAIVFVPAKAVPAVIRACAGKGVSRVMIQSAGFSETGPAGKALQEEIDDIAAGAGIRIWGPNCMGLVDVPRGHLFTFMHPRIAQVGLLEGRISLIVQSGMLSAGFLAVMKQRSIGVNKACSIGNKAGVDECDVLAYLLDDPDTDVVAMYLESVVRGRRFVQLAAGADKPLVLLKGGTSAPGARAALSHTSSLAGDARILAGALRTAGIVRAHDFAQMMDLANGLAHGRNLPPEGGTAVLTFSGASGIVSCDHLDARGLRLARFSDGSQRELEDLFPDWMPPSNPVDLFPAVERHGRVAAYRAAIRILMKDPNVDVLFIHYFVGLEDDFMELGLLKQEADRAGKHIVLWLIGHDETVRRVREEAHHAGIAAYDEISRAAEALAAAARYGSRRP